MTNDHPAEEDLVMLYYRESPPASEAGIRSHVETCPVCKAAYQNLTRVLDACNDLPVPEPHLAFESRMWNRIEPQLQPLNQGFRLPGLIRTRWFAVAAAAAMLVFAFMAGRFSRTTTVPVSLAAISAEGRHRVLLMALGDHLERSQMVLSEMANGPDQAAEDSEERQRARNLISENRLYRQTASDSGDPALGQVLDELERVLLDISHGTDSADIKARIESESLLFKLRILESNLNRTDSGSQPRSFAGTKEKL